MIRSLSLVVALWTLPVLAAERVDPQSSLLRKPADMVLSADGRFLLTANRGSGTVSVVDRTTRQVAAEWRIGEALVHLLPLPEGRLLALDAARSEAILLRQHDANLKIVGRAELPYSPIRAEASSDGGRVLVSCIWPRKLVSLRVSGDDLQPEHETTLPFAPRELLLLPETDTLLAADNFGGKLAVVDAVSLQLQHVREFPAHNIRALKLSQDGTWLVIAHQMLNSLAVTNSNDIHWGLLMSNELRWLKVHRVLDPADDFYRDGFMHPIGEPGRGGGDPTDVALVGQDQAIVTMGGTGEVGIGQHEAYGLFRAKVGQRPTAVVVAPEGDVAYVCSEFEATVSVVDLQAAKRVDTISLGQQPEPTVVDKGEQLFFDSRLSMEGWMSCHSCHPDGHTNAMANDNFSDNSFGAPKRVLSLLGKADTAPFGWLGHFPTMEAQVQNSVDRTMKGGKLSDDQTAALVAYLETLELPPPIDVLQNTRDTAAVARGRQTFLRNNCVKCHAPPAYTTPKAYDVGLRDEEGNREFHPPSLRGVGHRTSFFHDASVENLRDVFEVHGHQLAEDLSPDQIDDLLAFLRSL